MGCLFFCLCTTRISSAQETPPLNQNAPDKPLLFAQFPDRIECSVSDLQKIFASAIAEDISLGCGKTLVFTGKVVDKVQKTSRIISLNIKLTNYDNALLNISFLKQPDNSQKIIGRIIHPGHGDVLVLTEENKRYYFIKQSQRFFMAE